MADCSNFNEAINATNLGVDIVATTLYILLSNSRYVIYVTV